MIATLLLKGDWLTEQPGSSVICNNPIPSESTYSLPLIVVNFGVEKRNPFSEIDEAISLLLIEEGST